MEIVKEKKRVDEMEAHICGFLDKCHNDCKIN